MIVTHEIRVDLLRPGLETRIYAVQDDKYSRNLRMSLFVAGASWKIPDGTSALVRYRKSDGTGGTYDTIPDGTKAWSVTDNVLTVALAPQVLTVAGPVYLAVTLIKEKQQITTFSVLLHVQPNVSANVGESQNYSYVTGFLPAPQSAKIGQFVRVAAVDENGNVTAVETADVAENASGTYTIVLEQDDNGEYTASASYVQIAEARAAGKLVLLQYGIYITHILAGEPTESSFLFEPLLHSVEGIPGYIVDIQDNWSTVPVTEAETEVESEIFTVTLEETGDGQYSANAGYMEIAQARATEKLVLLRYGAYITHILAEAPTESSFLFEPLLHSVPGIHGYTVDIGDNWTAVPIDDTGTDDDADPWNGNAVVIYGVSDDGQIYNALMTGRMVYCLYNDLYYLPLMSWDEGSHTAIFGGCYGTEIITCTAEAGEWSAKTTDVSTSEPEVFVGIENTTVAEFNEAFASGKPCFLMKAIAGSGITMWVAYSCGTNRAYFYRVAPDGSVQFGTLDSDGNFTYSTAANSSSVESNVFIGDADTTVAEFVEAFRNGKSCFLMITHGGGYPEMWTMSTTTSTETYFYRITSGIVEYGTLNSDGTFESTSEDLKTLPFVGDSNTTVAEFYEAYSAGRACFMIRPRAGGTMMWTLTQAAVNAAFFGAVDRGSIMEGTLQADGTFNYTTLGRTDTIDEKSTDAQIPTAKAVYEFGNNSSQNIKPVEKTENMTQPVGVDENGGLFTAPGASGTVLVAASDAPDIIKAAAQYVCTGVNDQLIINEAINTVGEGEVRLSGGNFYLTGDIIPKDRIVLYGRNSVLNVCDEISSTITQAYTGGDTVIHVADASVFVLGQKVSTDAGIDSMYNCHIVAIDTENNTVTVDRALNNSKGFDANKYRLIADFSAVHCSQVTNVIIEGLTINGNKESYGFYDTRYGSNGIIFAESSQCKAINCTVNKARGHGILTTMSAQCQVLNCVVDDCQNLGIDVYGGDGGHLIHGCVAKNCDGIGIQGHNAVNTVFSNCIAVNCYEGISAQGTPDNVVITGCEVYNNINCGIKCVASVGKMVNIVGNTIIGGSLDGIQIDASASASDFAVSNNVIKNSVRNAINVIGIHGFSITGNHIVNPLATDTSTTIANKAAIKISGTASNGYVANNHILLDTTDTTGCPCGIAEYSLTGDNNVITSNVIRGARIAATQKLGTNSKFENNYEFA